VKDGLGEEWFKGFGLAACLSMRAAIERSDGADRAEDTEDTKREASWTFMLKTVISKKH
jgi:hypothetical protein